MNDKQVDLHIAEISRLRREADKLIDDNPGAVMDKVDLLARCLVYIGRLSSHLDGYYKRVYAKRKHDYADAYMSAKAHKTATAELAVSKLREMEAEAYEQHRRWRNAFDSTTEEIHALKLRLRQDQTIEGAANVYAASRTKAPPQAR